MGCAATKPDEVNIKIREVQSALIQLLSGRAEQWIIITSYKNYIFFKITLLQYGIINPQKQNFIFFHPVPT